MTQLQSSPVDRAQLYVKLKKLTIEKMLGGGYDGIVQATSQGTAVKAFKFIELYRNELEVYQYLLKWKISEVSGFHVPKLISFDDNLGIIEMTIVSPPFVVDFVAARIEIPPSYDEEIMDAFYESKKEDFEDDWPRVQRVVFGFQQHGIYLNDLHPANIRCR